MVDLVSVALEALKSEIDSLSEEESMAALLAIQGGYGSSCIWKEPHDKPNWESAWSFVKQCSTWNEAEKRYQALIGPESEDVYGNEVLPYFVWDFWDRKATGVPLHLEKPRRMRMSWLYRCLELHAMGLQKEDWVIGQMNFDKAAEQVKRYAEIYSDLQMRRHDGLAAFPYELPPYKAILAGGEEKLRSITFANGSRAVYLNQEAGTLQGDGKSGVALEEMSRYNYPASMLTQAKLVCKASAGNVGGMVYSINNASANEEWQKIKGGRVI